MRKNQVPKLRRFGPEKRGTPNRPPTLVGPVGVPRIWWGLGPEMEPHLAPLAIDLPCESCFLTAERPFVDEPLRTLRRLDFLQ